MTFEIKKLNEQPVTPFFLYIVVSLTWCFLYKVFGIVINTQIVYTWDCIILCRLGTRKWVSQFRLLFPISQCNSLYINLFYNKWSTLRNNINNLGFPVNNTVSRYQHWLWINSQPVLWQKSVPRVGSIMAKLLRYSRSFYNQLRPLHSNNLSVPIINLEKEKRAFQAVLPEFIDNVITRPKIKQLPEVASWMKQVGD